MNKTAILLALTAAFRKEFSDGLKHREPTYTKVAMVIPSTTAVNTYGWLSAFPKMKEWVGERTIKKLGKQAMSIENKLFESTVSVPRTDIEDDQVGMYRPIMKQAGVSAAELPDDLVWPLLPKGKETLCYDGQNFFDTDHVWYENVDGTGTTKNMSNLTTGIDAEAPSWYVIDDSNVLMPLVYQERVKPEFEEKFDPSKSDKVFLEDLYLYGVRARGNAGFGLWQLAHMVENESDQRSLGRSGENHERNQRRRRRIAESEPHFAGGAARAGRNRPPDFGADHSGRHNKYLGWPLEAAC